MILSGILKFIISFISGFLYWVVLPILTYFVLKIFLYIIDFSGERANKNYCRHYGYKGKRKWWD